MDSKGTAPEAKKSAGFIYVLTNPSYPWVKIGYADNVNARLKSLNGESGVPTAFRVYCTCEVDNRLEDLAVHDLIDTINPTLRVIDEINGKVRKREFYNMSPEQAFGILKSVAKLQHLPPERVCLNKAWTSGKEQDSADPQPAPPKSEPDPGPAPVQPVQESHPAVRQADPLSGFRPGSLKYSKKTASIYFDLRNRVQAAGAVYDDSRWPYVSFLKDGQTMLAAILMQDGLRLVVPGRQDASGGGRHDGDSMLRLPDEAALDQAMPLVWQALSGKPVPAPAPAPEPMSPAPEPAPKPAPSPAPLLEEDPSRHFAREAEASLTDFLEANPDAFRGKTVMLPRSAPDWPDFLHFFADRFESLGLKKLIATEAGGPGGAGTAFLLCEDNSDNGHIGPDDLEFCRLRGGAGLRDEDVLQFRDEADVAVAAPPQGQGATFATWAREGGKAYLSLGTGNPCVLRQPGEEKRPGNSGLTDAKNAKNDEFYTREEDVASEMEAYIKRNKDVFCGKTILLPCDDPSWSGFTQYFAKNFKRLGLKKLISTCYIEGLGGKTAREIEKNSPLFNPGKSRNSGKLLVMERDANGESNGIEFRGYLKGNGDFASKEVTKLRDEADFIITNPPFSKFRKFMSWIQEGKKQFIVMGNKNAITYKEIFPLLKEDRMWLGARPLGQDAYFILPEDYKAWVVANREEGSAYRMVNGEPMGRAAICWYTNVDHWKRHQPMSFASMADNLQNNEKLRKKLLQDYGSADAYPRYDNYDAIEIPYVDSIPSDYAGVMGVPVTYLDKHCPEQFEILGCTESEGKGFSNGLWDESSGVAQPLLNGQRVYKRIFIRNRHPEPAQAPALPEDAGGAEEEEDEGFRPGM